MSTGFADASLVGTVRPGGRLLVTRERLRAFAEATGQTDPVFVDVATARRAGHRDLPVPPTFYFSVELAVPDTFGYLTDVGIDLRTVLHGEQGFTYHRLAHAGDELSSSSVVVEVADRREGRLQLVTSETTVRTGHDEPVATMVNTVVVRRPGGAGR